MKKNRIPILILLFAFAFSNVGLPFTVHFCAMIQKLGHEKCEPMNSEPLPSKISCCEKKNESKVNYSSFKMNCCEIKLAAEPLKEKYVEDSSSLPKNEIKNFTIIISSEILLRNSFFSKSFSNNSSPPLQSENDLYIFNSILLI